MVTVFGAQAYRPPSLRREALPTTGALTHGFLCVRFDSDGMESVSVDSVEVPVLGFGTWRLEGDECRTAVKRALELGYRHVDTAQMYGNERAVGRAIEESPVEREEVFLVTKVRRKNLAPEDVRQTVEASLDRLGTDIDLLLIHSPSQTVPLEDSLAVMNEFQDEGSVSHIGVSNFSVDQTRAAMEASETPILTNQVEYHPFKDQDELLAFCRDEGVLLTAYSPLADGQVPGTDLLERIGAEHGKSAAQVAIRWLIQQENVAAIPKAASRDHQAENADVFDFRLTDEEMDQIAQLSRK